MSSFSPTSAKVHIVNLLYYLTSHTVRLPGSFDRFSDARNLERVKNELRTSTTRALRAVYFGNKSTYEELLQRAKLPTLHTWRLQAIAVVMYKVKNGLVPSYIADLFVVTNSQYHLRNSYFTIQRFRNVACGKRSLTFSTNLFHRLNHWTLLKSAPNWFISQACLDSTCQDCLLRNS